MIYTNDEIINAVKIVRAVCKEYSCKACPLFSEAKQVCAFDISPSYVELVTNQRYWRAVK